MALIKQEKSAKMKYTVTKIEQTNQILSDIVETIKRDIEVELSKKLPFEIKKEDDAIKVSLSVHIVDDIKELKILMLEKQIEAIDELHNLFIEDMRNSKDLGAVCATSQIIGQLNKKRESIIEILKNNQS